MRGCIRGLVAMSCLGLFVSWVGCGASEADTLKANAEIAAKAKTCDKCGLMSIPGKHDCGKTAYCGPCLGKCQTEKKAWPGEGAFEVKDNMTKLATCKACGGPVGQKK